MCQRSSRDPLVEYFCKKYQMHLLRQPREDVSVGELYVLQPKTLASGGSITSLLEPAVTLPPVRLGERLADLTAIQSRAAKVELGLGFLDGFLQALGAVASLGPIKTAYASKGATSLKIRIVDATRDSIDPGVLGDNLSGRGLRKNHPLAIRGSRFYISTAVMRTRTLAVTAEDDAGQVVELDAGVHALANASAKLDSHTETSGESVYNGSTPLAFAVELYELKWDPDTGSMQMVKPADYVATRGAQPPPPAIIGDSERAEAFISIG